MSGQVERAIGRETRATPGMGLKTERLKVEGALGVAGMARAVELLRAGGTVAFPTETVYGLGANALDPAAVEKIFVAKERPGWDPLIVHIEGREMLARVVALTPTLKDKAEALMSTFWPGPLTILLPRSAAVPDAVTAGRALVGVRTPAHPVARELIRRAGLPLAAPSANRFGGPSPTTAAHVLADLDGRIDAVLEGGAASVGVESTVLDLGARAIYRPGAVTAEMISKVIGEEVRVVAAAEVQSALAAPEALPSPGMGMRHYAPQARVVLVDGQQSLLEEIARHDGAEVGVMLPDEWQFGASAVQFRWGPWENAEILARLLYFGLRLLDSRGVKVIVCPVPAMDGLGEALRDRLEKAARGK
jgi:L-threonylcarbamoyladenylate synthase